MSPSDRTPSNDFDQRLSAWLDEQAPMREPDGLTYAVLARTRRTRRMPRWANPERWLPMTVITRPALAPPLRVAWLLLIALLALALVAGGAIVGSRLLGVTAGVPQGGEDVFVFGSYVGDESSPQLAGDIFTIRADGTDPRQLTSGSGIESHPAWSPDGTRIAYRLWQDSRHSVMVMDAGGREAITLAISDTTSQYCTDRWSLSWSPDGKSLIFPNSSLCQGGYDLYVVATDASSPPTQLLAPGTKSLHGTWSPDGTRIAFLGSEAAGSIGLYVADVGSGGALSGGLRASRIGPDLGPDLANPPSRPRWSPDGKELAVTAPDGVYVVQANGADQRLVVENATNPAWSPDGKQIAFQRAVDPSEYWSGRPCTARTWVIDAHGTNEGHRLEELGDLCAFAPTWSPDGTRLASILIASAPGDPERQVRPGAAPSPLWWHLGFVIVDGGIPPVILASDISGGNWQPVAAPLPPAPSFAAVSPTP